MAGDRLYRGRCEHGVFWMLLDSPLAAMVTSHGLSCPAGCVVTLDTIEPPPAESNGRS